MERPSGFDDDDDSEEFGSRRESSSHRGETVKADGKSGGSSDQRPSTPRSKHSATEQRRRSKINDRFQILRDLIPHSDQKRDKASFLLEVIEYIRFLHEKVQKYESAYPGWTDENAKLMPWVKVYFRSLWKDAPINCLCFLWEQNSSQGPGDSIPNPSQVIKNGSGSPGFVFSGKFDDNNISMAPEILSTAQNPTEPDMSAGVSIKVTEALPGFANMAAGSPVTQPNLYDSVGRGTGVTQPQLVSDADNMVSQLQSQWIRSPCPTDCNVTGDMLNGQEELTIDEGTISVSSAYSQGLLATLTQALQSSGIDLSQASISVQINLGKRATSRRPTATTTISNTKDLDDSPSGNRAVGHSMGSSGEESEQASKRHKLVENN